MALVLASTSSIRRQMLTAAGVAHEAVAPHVDEAGMKVQLSTADEVSLQLAEAKALSVSAGRSDDWVIGSDSVASVDGTLFDKPRSRHEAEQHLRFFSGKTMLLTSAVALARAEQIQWSHAESAVLEVRPLTEEFIGAYLDAEWPDVGYCVGVFRMEGRGVQLFSRVEGSHFTILGMPLLALLGALRHRGLLAS